MSDYTHSDCLYYDSGECDGPTEKRVSRSGLTRSVKCEAHEQELQERLDEIDQRYPDSEFAPSWFDPTYAGESWNDD